MTWILLCVVVEASSGGLTLTHELRIDNQRVRAGVLPVTALWSTPIKTGRLTVQGDTSRGKESFAREIRLSGCVSKTSVGTVSYDVSRRFRSRFTPLSELAPSAVSFARAHVCPRLPPTHHIDPTTRQTAYKLTAASRGIALVASTPFVDGGPPSWLCDAPALTEASASRANAWRGWNVAATALLKARALRLGLSHAVGKRGALSSEVVLNGASDAAAGGRLEAELVYRASISEGRSVTATLTPALQRPRAPDFDGASLGELEITYNDAAVERRALWTARASTTLGDGGRPRLAIVRRCSL